MHPTRSLWEVVSQPFKRSQLGLFQGRTKQYGNSVPFSKHKTRRTWLPNVQQKRLPSEILDGMVRVKLTTRALKTIKKKGGLDTYLKKTTPELLGHGGMRLRAKLQDQERIKQGLEPKRHELLTSEQLAQAAQPLVEAEDVDDKMRHVYNLRVKAGKSLGLPGPASAEETIAYVQARRQAKQVRREARVAAAAAAPIQPTTPQLEPTPSTN